MKRETALISTIVIIIVIVFGLLLAKSFKDTRMPSSTAIPVVPLSPPIISSPASVQPPATSSPVSTSPSSPTVPPNTITHADDNMTLTVLKGQNFVLELGDLDWIVSIGNPNIIHKLPNMALEEGVQGIYSVDAVGSTTLTASGRAHCAAGQACPMFVELFKVNIVAVAGN